MNSTSCSYSEGIWAIDNGHNLITNLPTGYRKFMIYHLLPDFLTARGKKNTIVLVSPLNIIQVRSSCLFGFEHIEYFVYGFFLNVAWLVPAFLVRKQKPTLPGKNMKLHTLLTIFEKNWIYQDFS